MVNNRKYIHIKKTKKNFKGVNSKLTKKDVSRLQKIYIPPAYKTIYLSRNPNNKVQLIAEDTKGRNQYFYNPEYVARGDKRKYKDLRGFISIADKIEKDNNIAISRIYNKISNSKNKSHIILHDDDYIHLVINLLINNHFRIGNIKYDRLYNSTGITTLKPSHITKHINHTKHNNIINIKFIGKKGIENIGIVSGKMATILLHLKKQYGHHNNVNYILCKSNGCIIKSDDITSYYKNKFGPDIKITPKMFRTYYANYHMLYYLQNIFDIHNTEYTSLTTDNRRNKYIKNNISNYVSHKLHNTPAICRKKYINNTLLDKVSANPQYYSSKKNSSIHSQLSHFIG